MQVGEKVITASSLGQKFKIKGLSQILSTDESFLDLVELFTLENQDLTYARPEIRLAYSIFLGASKAHMINTCIEKAQKQAEQRQLDEEKYPESEPPPPQEKPRSPLEEDLKVDHTAMSRLIVEDEQKDFGIVLSDDDEIDLTKL